MVGVKKIKEDKKHGSQFLLPWPINCWVKIQRYV